MKLSLELELIAICVSDVPSVTVCESLNMAFQLTGHYVWTEKQRFGLDKNLCLLSQIPSISDIRAATLLLPILPGTRPGIFLFPETSW